MDETKLLPKWMLKRYVILWKRFKDAEFNIEEAKQELKEDKKFILVLLSNLRKTGWIESKFDQKDARRRTYQLHHPEKIIEVMSVED